MKPNQHILKVLSLQKKSGKKLAIGLMVDTTTNLLPSGLTIYRLQPSGLSFSHN
jgi:hypothetical protein